MPIRIRHSEPQDAGAIHEILTAPHVVAGSMRLAHMPLASTAARLAPIPGRIQLTALRDDEVAGFAELLLETETFRAAHAGVLNMIATHPEHLRQGVCTALLSEVLTLSEGVLGLRRLSLIVWTENEAAAEIYRKNGFETEGILRSYVRTANGYSDATAMARIFD